MYEYILVCMYIYKQKGKRKRQTKRSTNYALATKNAQNTSRFSLCGSIKIMQH